MTDDITSKQRRSDVLLLVGVILLIFSLLFAVLKPSITGLLFDRSSESIDKDIFINTTYPSMVEVPLDIPYGANLTSLHVTGRIYGNASIYVSDGNRIFLVASTLSQRQALSSITGFEIYGDVTLQDDANISEKGIEDTAISGSTEGDSKADNAIDAQDNASDAQIDVTNILQENGSASDVPAIDVISSQDVIDAIVNYTAEDMNTAEDMADQNGTLEETSGQVEGQISENIIVDVPDANNTGVQEQTDTEIPAENDSEIPLDGSEAILPDAKDENSSINTSTIEDQELITGPAVETILEDSCVETCDFVIGKDAKLLIWPDEGSSVYISDVMISYVAQREEPEEIEDNETKTLLESRLDRIKVNKVIRHDVGLNTTGYDLFIEDKGSSGSIIIRGVKDISALKDVEFKKHSHSQKHVATDIVYVNSLEIDNATINIAADAPISAIAVCQDYDPVKDTCSAWEASDIGFTQKDGYITFTVTHFTGYAGLPYTTSKYYVTGTTNLTQTTPASLSIGTTQDNSINYVYTGTSLASGTYNMIIGKMLNPPPGVIKTTDKVTTRAYWTFGSLVTGTGNYYVYRNTSDTLTPICTNSGAITSNVLHVLSCSPASDMTIASTDNIVVYYNITATVGSGSGTNKFLYIYYDTSTYDTGFNYTYTVPFQINVTTNASTYYPNQSVNASGYLIWYNGTGLSGYVNVSFINSSGSIVYSANVTAQSSGLYYASYTIPYSDFGSWNVNVTGYYNSSLNAKDNTVFTLDNPFTITSSKIMPASPSYHTNLSGYCNATNIWGTNITYYYTWYRNGTVHSSGVTAKNYTPGTEVNVANITNSTLNISDVWKLSCLASTGAANTTWLNSSAANIMGDATAISACGIISSPGTYVLTQNISSTGVCINITTSNVILDCNGYTLNGTSDSSTTDFGIQVKNGGPLSNIAIRNCVIKGFFFATDIWNVSGLTVENINVPSGVIGPRFLTTRDTLVRNVNVTTTNASIYHSGASATQWGSNITLTEINARTTSYGGACLISYGDYMTLANSTCIGRGYTGASIKYAHNSTIYDVYANDTNPVGPGWHAGLYAEGANDSVISNSYGRGFAGFMFYNSYRNVVANNTFVAGAANTASWGLGFYTGTISQNNLVYNNTIIHEYNYNLIYIDAGSNTGNTFYWNNLTNTGVTAYYIYDGSGSNYYNSTLNGKPEGNIFYNVMSGAVTITGIAYSGFGKGLFVGNGGSGYPYSSGTSGNMVTANVVDNAPLTDVTSALPPSVTSSRISPSSPTTATNLVGYCNASDANGFNVTYSYQWHRNGVLNETGSTGSSLPGVELNVANISNSSLRVGDRWYLSCAADNGIFTSNWTNSSIASIGSQYGCQNITTPNIYFALDYNVTVNGSTCYIINATNVTLDCRGYSIIGNNTNLTFGVFSKANVTNVSNCVIRGFNVGVYLNDSSNSTIANSVINITYQWNQLPEYAVAIHLMGWGGDNDIVNNTLYSQNGSGAKITSYWGRNTIHNNSVMSIIQPGMFIHGSGDNLIYSNIMTSEQQDGISFFGGNNNRVENNTCQSNSSNMYAGIKLISGSGNNLTNNTAIGRATSAGIHLQSSTSSNILRNNNISGVTYGVRIDSSNTNTFTDNIIISNTSFIVYLSGTSSNNIIRNNSLNTTSGTGLMITAGSGLNKIYYNSFNQVSGYYVNNSNSTNTFNTTVGGIPQGNSYYNISMQDVYDSDSDGYGDSGSQYPINNSTWAAKWYGAGDDWGPATTRAPIVNSAPVMASARIVADQANISDNLSGFCNATDEDNDDITYYYAWYRNGTLNYTGITSNYTQGQEINVNNVSTALTYAGDNWTLSCMGSDGQANSSWINASVIIGTGDLPYTSGFTGTDLTIYADLTNISELYLANTTYGAINWSSGGYDVAYLNFTKNIKIGPRYIYVNVSGLNPTLNSTARLSIYGLPYAYPTIYRDGILCPSCPIIAYSAGTVTFTVPGFSNYTVGSSANLSIWDETDSVTRYANDLVKFYANYSNVTNGQPINGTGVYCEFKHNNTGSWSAAVNMTFNATSRVYEYNRTFASGGSFAFNVSCTNTLGYDNLTSTDKFVINTSSCRTLSSANSVYTLHNNITSSATCFAITANNVTLDCNGYTINYSTNGLSGYAVSVNSVDNITIRNCNIIDGDFGGYSGRDAVSLYDSENAQVYNNTINVGASSALMLTTINASIWNNTLISNSFKTIYLYDASNNALYNNTVQSGADSAIELYNTNLTIINGSSMKGTGAGSYGLVMVRSSDNRFIGSNITGVVYDVVANISSANNTLINCTFDPSKEYVLSSSEIIRKWYFDANVNNGTGSPMSGVNVTMKNSASAIVDSQLTNASGDISRIELTEYVDTGSIVYATPHTVIASMAGYASNSTSYNISSVHNAFTTIVLQAQTGLQCGELSSPGTYNMTSNLTSSGTCFTISSPDVTLDCKGYWIIHSTAGGASTRGIYSYADNTTIRNCNVLNGNSTTSASAISGILIYGGDNANLENNYVNSSSKIAIYIGDSYNTNLTNNTAIGYCSDWTQVILLESAHAGKYVDNTARGAGQYCYALYLSGSSNNTFINQTSSSAEVEGIFLEGSSNNVFIGVNATSSAEVAMTLYGGSSNNTLRDCKAISGASDLTLHNTGSNMNNTVINCSYDAETVGTSSQLIRKWYFDANVTNSSGLALGGANVTIRDGSSAIIDSQLTNASGDMSRIELTEYVNTAGARVYATPHNVTASLDGYITNITAVNLSAASNAYVNLVLESFTMIPPKVISIIQVSPQSPIESSQKKITFNFTVDDDNGNSTINISSARVIVNSSGISRQSSVGSCTGVAINSTAQNISCNVSLQYYDPAGSWSINISIMDNDGNYTQNTSTSFTYNTLYAIALNTGLYDMGAIDAGAKNRTAGILQINNTGNFNYTLVQIKAYDLVNGSYSLNVSNFRINITNSSSGRSLSNNTFVNISGAVLSRSTDSSIGNQSMYLYMDVPLGTAAKKYTSSSEWTLLLS